MRNKTSIFIDVDQRPKMKSNSERIVNKRRSTQCSKRPKFFRWRCLLFVLSELIQISEGSYHERRLYEDLMRDYNNLERPVANHTEPVIVYLKVSLQQLIDVDEKNQVVFVNAWLDYVSFFN